MAWNEPPPADAYAESMVLPALASVLLAIVAMCVPPLALAAVGVAWWCWWKCREDAAISGFRLTIAALFFSHAALLWWWLLAAVAFDGTRGVFWAAVIALVYGVLCTLTTCSAAWKYLVTAACFIFLVASMLGNAICVARNEAQRNGCLNNLGPMWIEARQGKRLQHELPERLPRE